MVVGGPSGGDGDVSITNTSGASPDPNDGNNNNSGGSNTSWNENDVGRVLKGLILAFALYKLLERSDWL